MNKLKIALIFSTVLILSGCASTMTFEQASEATQLGFWSGLWHGAIAPLAFIISLFDDNVAMYAINNNGNFYNLGFLIGINGALSSTSEAVKSKKIR